MTSFDEVVSTNPFRTELLVATQDGARMWALSDGDVEWQLPDHYTVEDMSRLSAWLEADRAARKAGEPSPSYLDYVRPDAPRVPLTADEIAGLVGWPPDGVNLGQLLGECQEEHPDGRP